MKSVEFAQRCDLRWFFSAWFPRTAGLILPNVNTELLVGVFGYFWSRNVIKCNFQFSTLQITLSTVAEKTSADEKRYHPARTQRSLRYVYSCVRSRHTWVVSAADTRTNLQSYQELPTADVRPIVRRARFVDTRVV